MRILSPEQAYFAQEDATEEQQRAQSSLLNVEKSQALTLKAITQYLEALRSVIDAESNEGGNGTTITDEDWQSTLNMAHDLVHELGYDQVYALREKGGI
jgi:hypothetical protein